MRRVTRSTSPPAPCRPRRRSRRASRARAARRSSRAAGALHAPRVAVVRQRVQVPPRRRAEQRDQAVSSTVATSPTVASPSSWSFRAVTGPTPQSRSTGSGCRNASSPSGGTTSSPSGFATRARDLGEELRPRHADRDRQPDPLAHLAAAASPRSPQAFPTILRRPRTSRNASSIERPSTSGVVSSNTSNTALLASEYADIRGSTTTAAGQSRRARAPPIAVRTPYAFAS